MITIRRLQAHHFKGLRDIDITFPEQGSILIEGLNEAGKSTLFEAIYVALYGEGLVGEETRPCLDDLVAFGSQSATVELSFKHSETSLEVRRTFKRNKNKNDIVHTAMLTVCCPGKTDETRHTVGAVNDRILQELGNLDGPTLRNSCFVEQKELGRLESLDRSSREKAIERLLGLERLTSLAQSYQNDAKELAKDKARALNHLSLAQALAEVADADREITAAQEVRDVVALRQKLGQLDALQNQEAEQAQEETLLQKQLHSVESRLEQADRYDEWLQSATLLLPELDHVRSLRLRSTQQAGQRQQRRSNILEHEIPTRLTRLGLLDQAQNALVGRENAIQSLRVAQSSAVRAQERFEQAQHWQGELQNAEREAQVALAQHHNALARAQDAERRDLLEAWLRQLSLATSLRGLDIDEEHLRDQCATAERQVASARLGVRRATLIIFAMAVASIVLSIVAFLFHLIILAGVAALAASSGVVQLFFAVHKQSTCQQHAQQCRHTLENALERNDLARSINTDSERTQQISARLGQLGIVSDAPIETLQQMYSELSQRIPTSLAEVRDVVHEVQLRSNQAQMQYETIHQRVTDLFPDIDLSDTQTSAQLLQEISEAKIAVYAADTLVQSAEADVNSALQAINLPLNADLPMLAKERGRLENELYQLQTEERSLSEDDGALASDVASSSDALMQRWRAVLAIAQSLGMSSPTRSLGNTPEEPIGALLVALSTQARDHLARLDRASARADRDNCQRQVGATRASLQECVRQRAELQADIVATLAARDIVLPAGEPLDYTTCVRYWPTLEHASSSELSRVDEQFEFARVRRARAEGEVERLTKLSSLPAETIATLDVATCEANLTHFNEQAEITERALRVISDARLRIMRMVLPTTERNMRVILPLLTGGRYQDVQLTSPDAEGGAERIDYRIYVFERSAGRMVSKSIFSGGTRDQCSLALRLAFALATLPQELGIAPGFLFLDEPLSAFDSERAGDLIHLLTQGEIARSFSQVIVISHQHAYSRDDFMYHITMEHGRVVESDLPSSSKRLADATAAKLDLPSIVPDVVSHPVVSAGQSADVQMPS
jgi:DNA repair exonuclease SbcCD ATPase subunit